jgi:hypothetical protein
VKTIDSRRLGLFGVTSFILLLIAGEWSLGQCPCGIITGDACAGTPANGTSCSTVPNLGGPTPCLGSDTHYPHPPLNRGCNSGGWVIDTIGTTYCSWGYPCEAGVDPNTGAAICVPNFHAPINNGPVNSLAIVDDCSA